MWMHVQNWSHNVHKDCENISGKHLVVSHLKKWTIKVKHFIFDQRACSFRSVVLVSIYGEIFVKFCSSDHLCAGNCGKSHFKVKVTVKTVCSHVQEINFFYSVAFV